VVPELGAKLSTVASLHTTARGGVDETTYCIDGIKYWLWVATSNQVCVLLLAPTRSSAELKQLLGENFEGFSAVTHTPQPQTAAAKQKCLAHLERDLEALKTSRFVGNREFAQRVGEILALARSSHRDHHGKLNREALALSPRPRMPATGFGQPAGRGGLMHNDWLTDLSVIGMSGSPS